MVLNIFSISIEINVKKQAKDFITRSDELRDPLEQSKLQYMKEIGMYR